MSGPLDRIEERIAERMRRCEDAAECVELILSRGYSPGPDFPPLRREYRNGAPLGDWRAFAGDGGAFFTPGGDGARRRSCKPAIPRPIRHGLARRRRRARSSTCMVNETELARRLGHREPHRAFRAPPAGRRVPAFPAHHRQTAHAGAAQRPGRPDMLAACDKRLHELAQRERENAVRSRESMARLHKWQARRRS